jgi:transcriptional regulator with XRE-family HTH domain
MNTLDIGNLIRTRRAFLHLRQQDLAEMSGITIKTIHLIESGTGNASLRTLEKLLNILGLEIIIQIRKTDL